MSGAGTRPSWTVSADTGGTFTDIVARGPDGSRHEAKVLSTGVLRLECFDWPGEDTARVAETDLPDGFLEGVSLARADAVVVGHDGDRLRFSDKVPGSPSVLEFETGLPAPLVGAHRVTGTPLRGELPPTKLRLATTRGTNALLEGTGANVALFVTKGFEDLLGIGDQTRPDLFALPVVKRATVASSSFGLPYRLDRRGRLPGGLDHRVLRRVAAEARERLPAEGGRVAVVSLCNGYLDPSVEARIAALLGAEGWDRVVAASAVSPLPGYLRRTETAVVEGYLGPVLADYLGGMENAPGVESVEIMTSAGGMVPRARFRAVDSLLSGPAGGVVGAREAADAAGIGEFLAFDMGGTSTDVSRFDGDPAYRDELSVGPARVFSEALRIDTVAAGGGSVCSFDGYAFTVGPGSAGADPGPACYGRGGPLALTDVHLLLDRIDPRRFRVPVDPAAAEGALSRVLAEAGHGEADDDFRRNVLEGFLAIANERMANALRGISVRDGLDPARFALVSFGGAGGLHACALADALGIERILQPGSAGILSADGLAAGRTEAGERRAVLLPLGEFAERAEEWFDEAAGPVREALGGAAREDGIEWRREAFVRLAGQEATLACAWSPGCDLAETFHRRFESVFGFRQENVVLEVASLRVRGRLRSEGPAPERFPGGPPAEGKGSGFLDGEVLPPGGHGEGPVVIAQRFGTLVVGEGWSFRAGERGSILLERRRGEGGRNPPVDPAAGKSGGEENVEVEHQLFRNRFGGIVDSMGELLRRTALSVNIRERQDFSCALLDREGTLVVNAPHIPVHLGALGACVRAVSERLDWRPGDIALTNHPAFGGSHLPDVTVLAPVFDASDRLAAFVAVRAHHAEIGGIRPGSMPPDAGSLAEEGVVLPPFHLIREERYRFDELRARLGPTGGSPHPSRAPEVNVADVSSQVAAAREGRRLLEALLADAGRERVEFYFDRILSQAEEWMRKAFSAWSRRETEPVVAEARLDGGERIRVRFESLSGGRVRLDFAGTSPGTGAFQCPPGVARSAILYACRLLGGRDMPLNEGILRPVEIRIPEGSLLSASFGGRDPREQPPVVAGNVEVSQRLVAVLLRAFRLEAGSQATMNNLSFGNPRFSHYETIAGGAGAVPGRRGASAVQVHMTNTAITDPEILEHRFPVRVERFGVRKNSGGRGLRPGGDGVVRVYRFEEETEVSLLTQQRDHGPPGLEGGEAGRPGRQWLVHPDGRREDLPYACTRRVKPGTRLVVKTPGGGAYGPA